MRALTEITQGLHRLLNREPSHQDMLRQETRDTLGGIARKLFNDSDFRSRTDSEGKEILMLYYDRLCPNSFFAHDLEAYKAIRVRIVEQGHAVDFLTSTGWHNLENYQGPNAVYREQIAKFLQEPKTWEERVRFARYCQVFLQ